MSDEALMSRVKDIRAHLRPGINSSDVASIGYTGIPGLTKQSSQNQDIPPPRIIPITTPPPPALPMDQADDPNKDKKKKKRNKKKTKKSKDAVQSV
jgi:hypothetical protein